MEIYIFLFICLSVVVYLSRRHQLENLHLISFILLFIVTAFRADTVGTDTSSYIAMFKTQRYDVDIEVGFQSFLNFVNLFTSNYTVFLLTVTSLQYVTLYRFIKLNSRDVPLSLFLFLSLGFFFFYLSGMRQSIAISFFLLSLHYYLLRSYLVSLLLISIAGLFHITVLVFIPLMLIITNVKIGLRTVYVATCLSLLLGRTGMFDFQDLLNDFGIYDLFQGEGVLDRYKGYGDFGEDLVLSNFGFLRVALAPTLLFLYIFYKSKDKDDIYLKLYFLGVVLSNLMVSFPIGFRVAMYFSILQIIVIANVFSTSKTAKLKYIFLAMYGFVVLITAINTAYKGVSTSRNDIVPYRLFFEEK